MMREVFHSIRGVRHSVRGVRNLLREPPVVIEKVELPRLRMGRSKGLWLLLIVALIAWWFWERDRKNKQTAPPILKN